MNSTSWVNGWGLLLRRYHYRIWQDKEHGKQRMERGSADFPDLETVIEDQKKVMVPRSCIMLTLR